MSAWVCMQIIKILFWQIKIYQNLILVHVIHYYSIVAELKDEVYKFKNNKE